jgi:hypothetical protein
MTGRTAGALNLRARSAAAVDLAEALGLIVGERQLDRRSQII